MRFFFLNYKQIFLITIHFSKFIDQNRDLEWPQYQCLNTLKKKKKAVFQDSFTFSSSSDFVKRNGT